MPTKEKRLQEMHESAEAFGKINDDGFLGRTLPNMLQLFELLKDLKGEPEPELEELLGNLDEPFSATLMKFIDESGMKDSQVYKRAGIDRRTFSKIRNPDYRPTKRTVLALAIGLELNLDKTEELLKCAGYAFSQSRKFDVIVQFFITNKRYDIMEINEVLYDYDQALLGG